MGGRLDAVNIVENEVALITSIGLDHEQWLGSDREVIGREKAGVFKSGAFAVCADPAPPASIAARANELQTTLLQSGKDFKITGDVNQGNYIWQGNHELIPERWQQISDLRLPIAGKHQAQNLSGVMAVLALTQGRTGIEPAQIYRGLAATSIRARCEVISHSPTIVLDVAHNSDSAEELATYLHTHPVAGETYAVFGVLKDKELGPILNSVSKNVDHWFLAGLEGERGQSAEQLGRRLEEILPASRYRTFVNPVAAYDAVREMVNTADRIVIFGSFYTVGDIIAFLEQESSAS
jgi:dihydrofolate synthase/folylpolyglutamate synthase